MSEKKQSDGAAWRKVVKTKNGESTILSITIGDKRYTAWENSYKKEGDNQPDYKLYVDTYEKKSTQSSAPRSVTPQPAAVPAKQDFKDLPF